MWLCKDLISLACVQGHIDSFTCVHRGQSKPHLFLVIHVFSFWSSWIKYQILSQETCYYSDLFVIWKVHFMYFKLCLHDGYFYWPVLIKRKQNTSQSTTPTHEETRFSLDKYLPSFQACSFWASTQVITLRPKSAWCTVASFRDLVSFISSYFFVSIVLSEYAGTCCYWSIVYWIICQNRCWWH